MFRFGLFGFFWVALLVHTSGNAFARIACTMPCDRIAQGSVLQRVQQLESALEQDKVQRLCALQQAPYLQLDQWAKDCPKSNEKDVATLTQFLIKPAISDIEKARVIFTWIATHVRYDDVAFNTNRFPVYTPELVLKSKKAVCAGFSILYTAMCREAALDAMTVTGYAKGYGYRSGDRMDDVNHAWNAVKIDQVWKLFDVTWAQGYGKNVNGKLVSTSLFEPFWFDVSPKIFVFSHYPMAPKWLNLPEPISLKQFEDLPNLTEEFFCLGFNADEIYTKATSQNMRMFVKTYPTQATVKAIRMPFYPAIEKGKPVVFELQSSTDQVAVVEDGQWTYFNKMGDVFTLEYVPKQSKITIVVKSAGKKTGFDTLAEYKVK